MTSAGLGYDLGLGDWHQWLQDAGIVLGADREQVRRVIIDIPMGDTVKVYVERYGLTTADFRPPRGINADSPTVEMHVIDHRQKEE